ncbi:putative cytochrome p450 alkane hydroxylase protein [Botrytis fragariae]|uniref:Putative cytochrome p450 alkane hydroxylase protein n=1 Tax=Botrytis fragariae TaxID=1964551 RepID=A0A8H6EPI3_9HELO|nr:putative cytochrome p450 alkane hydroxylase protein [Botrytis fragariae]KAF5879689.1 putative cytochrome p450 alkane hydroxylase protein [Botrytis fragariae]
MDVSFYGGQQPLLRYIIVIVVTALVLLWPKLKRSRNIRNLKRRHNCAEPDKFPHQNVLDTYLARLQAQAVQEGYLFRLYKSQFVTHGKTFSEVWRAALAAEDFGKDAGREAAQWPLLEPSIFSDGPAWSLSNKFLDLIPEEGQTFDIQPLLHRLFLDTSIDFIFGRSLNGLQGSPESIEFTEAFTAGLKGISARRDAPWFQFHYQRLIEDPNWKKSYKTVHRFVDEQVELALKDTAKTDSDSAPSDGKRYVLLHKMAKQIRGPIALRYHVLGFFAPARDVTSRLVANALFQLARHPNEWKKLRRISLELGGASLSIEKLKQLADFRITSSAWHMVYEPRHDSDIWGDDVESFRPDRFVGRKMNWKFLPFYGGPRICPAQQQAMAQAAYVLVRLTQKFGVIENRDPDLEFLQLIKMGVESMNGAKIAFI